MIVTCDHCGARYKLDESKISGRGAKINCPRCRHVFVVYKDAAEAAGDVAAPDAAPDAGPASAPAAAAPPATASASLEPALDVYKLDFRTVGIQSWKVKVKIGLVYDFSDYKTLSKYISDGRVTPADQLSHNGQNWTPIGQIPDLKAHFVQVYRAAGKAMAAPPPDEDGNSVEDFEGDESPTNIMGMDNLADTLGAERASQANGGFTPTQLGDSNRASQVEELFKTGGDREDLPRRFVDPFEQRKQARERKAKGSRNRGADAGDHRASAKAATPPAEAAAPVPTPKPNRTPVLVAAALLLLVGGGGALWWAQQQTPTPTTGVLVAPTPPKSKNKAKQSGGIVPEDVGDAADAEEENWGIEEEQQLIPVVPKEFRNGASPGARPPAPPPSAAQQASQGATAGVEYSNLTARDHAQAGWDAYRRADYTTAVAAFRQAVSMEGGNAEYAGKLGASLMRAGDPAGASSYLQRAAQAGYAPAHEFLGDLAAEQGDNAGAVGHYQAYLATRPSDGARVQQKIDRLNGT
jgi:predicted Zn finger-like uncharacterized protein